MNIKKLLNKDVKKLDDLKYVKELNKTLIADLYTAAEKDKKDVWGKDKEYIKNFIEGKQWDNNTAPVPQGMAFRGGKPIYYEGLIATFNAESVQSATRPLYSVNLTKSICETLIAKFCEPDPLCRAFSRSDYHYDIELLRKIDLLAYHLMYEENNFKSIYQNVLMEALTQRHSYIWIKWDEKNGKTHIPIKWIFLESDALLIDPNATDINFAEYVIHILKMKYSELKYKYNFKSENENEKNIDNNTIIEVKHWWIRIKIEGKYKWIMIPEYENQFLKILDEDGEAIDVEAHDYLPFTIFKGKPTKLWYGDHFVFDLIPFNMMYNLVVTMEQWNIRKVIDKPWIGTGVKASVVKEGDQPGGFISLPNTANLRGAENVTLVGSTEFLTLKQTIKEEISDIVGDLGILSGNNPPRVYSGKMLESVKEMAELKPRMMEESFWYSISEVFKKSLLCIVQEKQSVSLFDPDFDNGDGSFGANIDITENDIMNNQYTLYIEIDDAKLMTKKERFNSLIQLLQYGKLQEFLPGSLILKSVNEQMPGLIPESLIKKLETNENAQQPQQPGQQQLGINPSNQAVPQQSGAGVTPTAPAVSNDDVPNSVFNMEINNYVNKLTDAGIPEKQIGDLMDQVGLMIDKDGKTLIPKPDENKTKAEILDDLEILSNKFLNIFSRRR